MLAESSIRPVSALAARGITADVVSGPVASRVSGEMMQAGREALTTSVRETGLAIGITAAVVVVAVLCVGGGIACGCFLGVCARGSEDGEQRRDGQV